MDHDANGCKWQVCAIPQNLARDIPWPFFHLFTCCLDGQWWNTRPCWSAQDPRVTSKELQCSVYRDHHRSVSSKGTHFGRSQFWIPLFPWNYTLLATAPTRLNVKIIFGIVRAWLSSPPAALVANSGTPRRCDPRRALPLWWPPCYYIAVTHKKTSKRHQCSTFITVIILNCWREPRIFSFEVLWDTLSHFFIKLCQKMRPWYHLVI